MPYWPEAMKYDATLKKIFHRPPNRLLSYAVGREIVAGRVLPTDLITVENLHPDLLFEADDGTLIHAELHGYGMEEFACRNLIYFGLLLRDYQRPPVQVVFWIGSGPVGVTGGLQYPETLDYRYRVIDVKQIDAEWLLEGAEVEESVFAVLCKSADPRQTVARIVRRIRESPVERQREAVAQLLVLSGLRGLKGLVREEITRMPFTIDIHENEFLEEIYQDGLEKGLERGLERGLEKGLEKGIDQGRIENARELVTGLAEAKFGALSPAAKERIGAAGLPDLHRWSRQVLSAQHLDEIFT